MADLMRQVGEVLKEGRARRGWNQAALATYAGVSMIVVQGVEQGVRLPNIKTIVRLFEALGAVPTLAVAWTTPPAVTAPTSSPPTVQAAPPAAVSPPQPEEDEPTETASEGGLSTQEMDRLIAEEFRKRFPDPEHIAARTYLQEHPDIAEALSRLTAPQAAR